MSPLNEMIDEFADQGYIISLSLPMSTDNDNGLWLQFILEIITEPVVKMTWFVLIFQKIGTCMKCGLTKHMALYAELEGMSLLTSMRDEKYRSSLGGSGDSSSRHVLCCLI